jgi:catechol 2,3-dioxygenase-like lactoylglutathione lyase family enzyme
MCLVRGVRSVELVVSNVDEAKKFYGAIWGLQPVVAHQNTRAYRGTGRYHHILGLHSGAKPAVIRITFDVADRRSVDALNDSVSAAGCRFVGEPAQVSSPGGGYGFGCKDPEGRNLAFVCECADHADTNDEPDRPRKITHVNLNTGDFERSYRFFTEALDFRLSDENGPLCFLRCANRDHNSIVPALADRPTLNHIAFELPDLDSVMRGAGRMNDHGFPIEWGVGRHGPGNNVFAYFAGPDEMPIEYTAEVMQLDDNHLPCGTDYWKFPPGRSDQWGVTAPRSARFARIQRLVGFTDDGHRLS